MLAENGCSNVNLMQVTRKREAEASRFALRKPSLWGQLLPPTTSTET
jgi:hypothetical protein